MNMQAKEPENFHSILVPIDFACPSSAALLHAARLADSSDGKLTILHVVHGTGNTRGFYKSTDPKYRSFPVNIIAVRMLREFITGIRDANPELKSLTRAKMITVEGLPSVRIPEVAKSISADLVVVGSNERGFLSRLLRNSVSRKVVRKSEAPVIVVHMKPKNTGTKSVRIATELEKVSHPGIGNTALSQ